MANPTKRGSGLLFKNFKKKQDNHPGYIGTCEIEGRKLEISAWVKPLRNKKGFFMSLAFSDVREKSHSNGMPTEETPAPEAPAAEPLESTHNQPAENFLV